MPAYPPAIRRCQHIKVNGIQCGSPAQRNERHCYFHEQCRLMSREINMKFSEHGIITLPTLEDPNSIQLGLAEVMRLLVTRQIDHRIASLLLRALRTAAANVKFTSFEPKPTQIVIDPKCVEHRPLGATAWSTVEGREYDLAETNNPETNNAETKNAETNNPETNNPETDLPKKDCSDKNSLETGPESEAPLMRPIAGVARHPNFLDRPEQNVAGPARTQTAPPLSENRELRTENWG